MRYSIEVLCLLLAVGLAPLVGAAAPVAATGLPATETRAEVQLQAPAPAVFEQLGKLYGVRVQVDADLPQNVLRLSLRQVDFAAALGAAAAAAAAFWVVEPDGSVLVAADTPAQRERYQRQVRRTFALPGRSPEELNESVRLLREVLDMRRVRPDPRSNTLSVFDTPYRLAVAEQLLAQLPYDPGEVWVDVTVLEVDRERALQLGLVVPDNAFIVNLGAGIFLARDPESLPEVLRALLNRRLLPQPFAEATLQALLSGGLLDPSQAISLLPSFILFGGGRTTFAAHLPSFELALLQLSRVTRSWRQFSLRTRVGQQASAFIGQRFPIVFATFSAIFLPAVIEELIRLGQFVPPVPAIRYEDLGVTVTVTPYVHRKREISLTLKLEQLALTGQELNGIPVLSSRLLEHQVRLRDGETLLLAGLRRETQEGTSTNLPGLSSVPALGSLFGRVEPQRRTSELLLLITPRLTRLPAQERLVTRTLYVGLEKDFAAVGRPPATTPERRAPTPQPQAPPPTPPPPTPPQPQPPRPPQD